MTDDPLSDRQVCIGCGAPLIELNPLWGMCSQCIEGTKKKLARAIQQRKVPDKSKKFSRYIPMLAKK